MEYSVAQTRGGESGGAASPGSLFRCPRKKAFANKRKRLSEYTLNRRKSNNYCKKMTCFELAAENAE
jgi:hypothetical protein